MNQMENPGYGIKTINRVDYPETLANMKHPPKKLYYRGDFPGPKGNKYLCVVGSRRWTAYGRDAVNTIIGGLKGYPVTVVSGLAIGIDSMAHIAALEAGLHCVAFPGSTLEWNCIYPSSHSRLAHEIVNAGGALVSMWKTGYITREWAFPARNTLMAGISHATLIVEAAHRSGSLMTAKHAEEYDRDVMAIPGPINSANSYGPHMLLKNGATMVTSAADVLMELGFKVPTETPGKTGGRIDSARLRSLNSDLKALIEMISREEMPIEAIKARTSKGISEINVLISSLELEGLITVENGIAKIATTG